MSKSGKKKIKISLAKAWRAVRVNKVSSYQDGKQVRK